MDKFSFVPDKSRGMIGARFHSAVCEVPRVFQTALKEEKREVLPESVSIDRTQLAINAQDAPIIRHINSLRKVSVGKLLSEGLEYIRDLRELVTANKDETSKTKLSKVISRINELFYGRKKPNKASLKKVATHVRDSLLVLASRYPKTTVSEYAYDCADVIAA